jgi:hypothetical protein
MRTPIFNRENLSDSSGAGSAQEKKLGAARPKISVGSREILSRK